MVSNDQTLEIQAEGGIKWTETAADRELGSLSSIPPHLLAQVLPKKSNAKIMLHGQTRSGTSSAPKDQLIVTYDLPLTNTKEIPQGWQHLENLAQGNLSVGLLVLSGTDGSGKHCWTSAGPPRRYKKANIIIYQIEWWGRMFLISTQLFNTSSTVLS